MQTTRLRLPFRRVLPALLLLLLPLLALPTRLEARGATASRSTLAKRLSRRLAKAHLKAGRYGIVVMTRGAHPFVNYTAGATTPLVPASAAKLLTAACALDLLGPGHALRTLVSARGDLTADGVLQGDLVVHGRGDPNLSGRSHDGDPMAVPRDLAERVFGAGIRRVTGALVLDEGPFDDAYVHPDWSAADKRRWYGAPVGGLAFNDDCIDVKIVAGKAGSRPALTLPATSGPWRVKNTLRTIRGARAAAGGRWIEAGRVLEVHGRLPPGGRASFNVPVPDPALFLGGALRRALAGANIRVDGLTRHARDEADRKPGRVVALHESDLPATLNVMNTRSQNFYAGMLFKLCGAQVTGVGSWEAGQTAVRTMLARRHIEDGGTTQMRDGSGLSPRNHVSAGVLAQVLHAFDEDVLRGPVLYASLPVSGMTGTLRRRLREKGVKGRVHAKTGTLNDTRARALAGYVDGRADGRGGKVFAILLNGPGASHALIDDLVREICR